MCIRDRLHIQVIPNVRGERRRRETQVVRVHFALVGDGNEHVEKIVTSLVVVVCGPSGCSCLGDGARSMTTRKTFNSVLVSLASFSKKTFRDICTHPKLKLNSFVFRPHYFYQFRHKKRFELEREKDRERTNRTSFRSILPPAYLRSVLRAAFTLTSF